MITLAYRKIKMAEKLTFEVSQTRLQFAAHIFVRECLRQFIKMHPGTAPEHMPIGALCEYPNRQQVALQKAVEKAIEAAFGMDDLYRQYLKDKIDASNQQK